MTTAQALAQDAPAAQRPGASEVEAARKAGAEAADLVIRAQMNAGIPAEKIQDSAERVLADRFEEPTAASDAFYAAYDETAEMYMAEMREPDRDIEAG
jgi:hypothetical protein